MYSFEYIICSVPFDSLYNTMQNTEKVAIRVQKQPLTRAVGLRLTEEEFAMCQALADTERRSIASVARIFVQDGLSRMAENAEQHAG